MNRRRPVRQIPPLVWTTARDIASNYGRTPADLVTFADWAAYLSAAELAIAGDGIDPNTVEHRAA
ncbi:hypothetical protein ACIBCN_18940 [Nocardia sp. NPDC051052]|uniref:hypothetical protein n=1 Tax=Nocardia sp. NPDC051052 TaxID=3364322 RepID=UPI0037AD665A